MTAKEREYKISAWVRQDLIRFLLLLGVKG